MRRTVQKSTSLIQNSAKPKFLRHSASAAFHHALNAKRRNTVQYLTMMHDGIRPHSSCLFRKGHEKHVRLEFRFSLFIAKVLEELECLYGHVLLDASGTLIFFKW